MIQRIFRRKIYDKILKWKEENQGKTALLIEGARRVGKSTVVEEFARKEYQSCIIIDFNKARKEVKIFEDLMDMDLLFLKLQQTYHVELVDRNSVIVSMKCSNAHLLAKPSNTLYKMVVTTILRQVH